MRLHQSGFVDLLELESPIDPGRIIRHLNGRIRLKYGNFRPGAGTRIWCTVIRFSYGIIWCRIRRSFTVLRIRAVFVHRIRAVFVPCHESALHGSRLRAVSTLYSRHIIELFKTLVDDYG